MNDYVISHVRTFIPLAVGVLFAWLASKNLQFDQSTTDGLIAFLTGAFGVVYYILVRFLEQFVSAKFGWLLGFAKKPGYNLVPAEAPTGK